VASITPGVKSKLFIPTSGQPKVLFTIKPSNPNKAQWVNHYRYSERSAKPQYSGSSKSVFMQSKVSCPTNTKPALNVQAKPAGHMKQPASTSIGGKWQVIKSNIGANKSSQNKVQTSIQLIAKILKFWYPA